jgi:hypothetical protein
MRIRVGVDETVEEVLKTSVSRSSKSNYGRKSWQSRMTP